MKKFLKLFAIVLAIFMVMAIFAACHKKTNDPDTPDKPVDNTPVDDNPTPDNPTPDTPVHEHAWDEGTVTKEATCTEAGEKVYKCSGCDETKVEVIAALGHTWDAGKVTKEATFAAEGETTFTCTVCGETKVEPIAKIEVDTTPEEKGKIVDAGDARYRANGDGTYTYLEYRGDKLEVVIPAVANNRRVTAIEEGAFDPSAEIYSITIQNGIEVIEADAFANCTALTEIVIPDSVKEIGDNAFKGCAALQQVKLGAGVESFSANVFAGCTQIAILDLGGLTELEAGTFADAEKSLVKVTIGAKMGDLNGCFETATDYKLVVIENKSTNPEFDAGVKVTALLDKIEDTEGIAVVVEKDYVFYLNGKGGVALISYIGLDGNKLDPEDDEEEKVQAAKKIVLPESYGKDEDKYTIYKYAFYDRDDIATVIIDKGATAVGESAFDANKLTKVTIPATVTSIAANAFEDCTKLAEVIFEGKDTTVDSTAFTNCVALKTATMPANADNTIRDAAAWENLTLTGETVPAFKFEAKTALKKVTFAETIKTIGDGAFVECTSFATLTFDGTPALTTIGEKAFGNTAITALNLPKSVTDIDIGITTGCNDLTTITVVDGNTVYSAAGNCLIEIDTKTVIAGCKVSVIPTDGSVTKIGENAFEGLDITSITIPANVTEIGKEAFILCTSLAEVKLSNNLTTIGADAFKSCPIKTLTFPIAKADVIFADTTGIVKGNLETITINGTTAIPDNAFKGCGTNLKSVTINEGITAIGQEAFSGCYALKTVNIAASVTTIKLGAFYTAGNSGSDEFVVNFATGSQLATLEESAFLECDNLKSISLPDTLTAIGKRGLEGCDALTDITFAGDKTEWAAVTKGDDWNKNTGAYTIHCTDGDIAKA